MKHISHELLWIVWQFNTGEQISKRIALNQCDRFVIVWLQTKHRWHECLMIHIMPASLCVLDFEWSIGGLPQPSHSGNLRPLKTKAINAENLSFYKRRVFSENHFPELLPPQFHSAIETHQRMKESFHQATTNDFPPHFFFFTFMVIQYVWIESKYIIIFVVIINCIWHPVSVVGATIFPDIWIPKSKSNYCFNQKVWSIFPLIPSRFWSFSETKQFLWPHHKAIADDGSTNTLSQWTAGIQL